MDALKSSTAIRKAGSIARCNTVRRPPVGIIRGQKGLINMNNTRRKHLSEIQERIQDIMRDLDEIRNEEDDAYTNLPESIQYSERGDTMAEAIDNLDEAISILEDVDSYIEDAKGA